MNLPKDPIMLFSFINTQLRDSFPHLKILQKVMGYQKQI